MESYLGWEKSGLEALAAEKVLLDLMELLRHSERRGLSAAQYFSHFDLKRQGSIDVKEFISGLNKLGMGVTKSTGELVFQGIGGIGATFLTARDFSDALLQSDAGLIDEMRLKEIEPEVTWAKNNIKKRSSKSTGSRRTEPKKNIENPSASTLQCIALEVSETQSAMEEKDELLHLEDGVIMTYRVIEQRDRLVKSKAFLSADGFENMFSVDDTQQPPPLSGFTLVVVPDLFMTLDALQTNLEALVVKYPSARLVLVGLPGLPNSIWPSKSQLNPELHCNAIGKLLHCLHSAGRLSSSGSAYNSRIGTANNGEKGGMGDPVFLLGFGVGAYSLSRFISLLLPGMHWLQLRVKAVVIVNGLIKISKSFRSLCVELQHHLENAATAMEVRELVCSLHLWDGYMREKGKEECMERFWLDRGSMCDVGRRGGVGYTGVLAQLRGILAYNPEDFDAASILLTNIPVVAVYSTEDVFLNPRGAAVFQSTQLPPERSLVASVSDSLAPGAVHMSWLRAGHEVLQERNSYLMGLIGSLVEMCGVRCDPGSHPGSTPKTAGGAQQAAEDGDVDGIPLEDEGEEVWDTLGDELFRGTSGVSGVSGTVSPIREGTHGAYSGYGSPKNLSDDDSFSSEPSSPSPLARDLSRGFSMRRDASSSTLGGLLGPSLSRKSSGLRTGNSSRRPSNTEAERIRRDLKNAAKAAVEKRRLLLEKQSESEEMLGMYSADMFSRAAEEFRLELTLRRDRATRKVEERKRLTQERRVKALEAIEVKLTRQRRQRAKDRKAQTDEIIKLLEGCENIIENIAIGVGSATEENTDLLLSAMGQISRESDVAAIATTYIQIKEFCEARERTIEARKKYMGLQEKTKAVQTLRDRVDGEGRRISRAVEVIENSPSLVGEGFDAYTESTKLRKALDIKNRDYYRLQDLLEKKRAEVEVMRICLLREEGILTEQYNEIDRLLEEMRVTEQDSLTTIAALRVQSQDMIEERRICQAKEAAIRGKHDVIVKELQHIESCTTYFIDTDVWVGGYMQRCRKVEVVTHMRKEVESSSAQLFDLPEKLKVFKKQANELNSALRKEKRICHRMSVTLLIFREALDMMIAVPAESIVAQLNTLQAAAIEEERKREKDLEMNISEAEQGSAQSSTLIERVRLKGLQHQTKDERLFISLDLVMNPWCYSELTPDDIKIMEVDMDYHSDLTPTDLERIDRLPVLISLALPFLHSKKEVEAHRLLNKYKRGLDDDLLRERDQKTSAFRKNEAQDNDIGGGAFSYTLDSMTHRIRKGKEDHRELEASHAIVLRERRRDRVRCLSLYVSGRVDVSVTGGGNGGNGGTGGEEMEAIPTAEEVAWIQLEMTLAPHLFPHPLPSLPLSPPPFSLVPSVPSRSSGSPGSMSHVPPTSPSPYSPTSPSSPFSHTSHFSHSSRPDRHNDHDESDGFIGWVNPFSADELQDISSSAAAADAESLLTGGDVTGGDDTTDLDLDTLKARRLLEKYYVLQDESVTGHTRLQSLLFLASSLAALLQQSFEVEDREERRGANRSQSAGVRRQLLKNINDISDLKVWGSWDQVHPASAGAASQQSKFSASGYSAARDHLASYALKANLVRAEMMITAYDDELGYEPDVEDEVHLEPELMTGMDALTALPAARTTPETLFDQHQWYILESISAFALTKASEVRGREVLIIHSGSATLYDEPGTTLDTRKSRAHHFDIPDKDTLRVLDMTVSLIFQGSFGPRGYKPGRLAASLFRLSGLSDVTAPLPQPVGYAPYSMQSPNMPDTMGRIVILHRPSTRPLRPGSFRLVVGAAASTRYSVHVTCRYAQTALPLIDAEIVTARAQQGRLAVCLEETDNITETSRLAEHKARVCRIMVLEAESESQRCQVTALSISRQLQKDDIEMSMTEKERRGLENQLNAFENDYADWADRFITRNSEAEDIEMGLVSMLNKVTRLGEEKAQLLVQLNKARQELPACMVLLRSVTEAANVAARLNAPRPTVLAEEGRGDGTGEGETLEALVVSPAEEVRKRMRADGFAALSLHEKQWSLLDRALHPSKYGWLMEQEEAERQKTSGRKNSNPLKDATDSSLHASLDNFRLSKLEILHIMKAPFAMLSRKEIAVRKLLANIHDDAEVARRGASSAVSGFDPHLAERTRSKQPMTHTREEAEWASIDKILHPAVWKYYGAKDPEEIFQAKIRAKPIAPPPPPESAAIAAAKNQAQQKSLIGKFLGIDAHTTEDIEEEVKGTGLSFDLNRYASAARKTMAKGGDRVWRCKWSKDQILRVWQTPRRKLVDEEQQQALTLLQKYSGTYKAYVEANTGWAVRMDHLQGKQDRSLISWDRHGKIAPTDIDFRVRRIIREIDRARSTINPVMESDALHGLDQRFPTTVLHSQLVAELDVLLGEQIKDSERTRRKRAESSGSEGSDRSGGMSDDLDDDDAPGDGDDVIRSKEETQKRAKGRAKKARAIARQQEIDKIVRRQLANKSKKKGGYSLAENMIAMELGAGGCIACRHNPCLWAPCIDEVICLSRKKALEDEIRRVKQNASMAVFESTVSLSAQLGGQMKFSRANLLYELQGEERDLNREIQLNYVDMELHDAYASKKEYITVEHLHGYKVMLWTNNARVALQARQTRLVALTVAKSVVDDILDFMLEGWLFGERESEFTVLGHVPSLKPGKGEKIRAGQDQIRTLGRAVEKLKQRAEARKKGILLDMFTRGGTSEKAADIERNSQFSLERERVTKDGRDTEHLLNETETTLHFGVFMMTLMYFRVMHMIKREKKSWGGEDDEISAEKGISKKNSMKANAKKAIDSLGMTKERLRMMDEERNCVTRERKLEAVMVKYRIGEARRIERRLRERRKEIRRMQAVAVRNKLESSSVRCIQRILRGYFARKNVYRWAVKRAEWEAMKMVMQGAAVRIQRMYRGYLGRLRYIVVRTEIAQFIAIVRFQEAEADEVEYWQDHPWSRYKRKQMEWLSKKYSLDTFSLTGGAVLGAPVYFEKERADEMKAQVVRNEAALKEYAERVVEGEEEED